VIEAINATGYGLTLGLHSRIDATRRLVESRARAGNFYVNRNQIGAVVGSQPFGGEGLSAPAPRPAARTTCRASPPSGSPPSTPPPPGGNAEPAGRGISSRALARPRPVRNLFAMAILSDKWIREKAQTEGMIEPFVEAQRRDGCISYGLSSYGYDAAGRRRVQDLHQRRIPRWSTQGLSPRQLRRPQDRCLRDPAQQLRARPHGRILPRAARRAGDLPRQEHLTRAAGSS
jgi:hypothetical protein